MLSNGVEIEDIHEFVREVYPIGLRVNTIGECSVANCPCKIPRMARLKDRLLDEEVKKNEELDEQYWQLKKEEYAEKMGKLATHPFAVSARNMLDEMNKGYINGKKCEYCNGTGELEVLGDGANFEVDVVDVKPCPHCN